MSDHSPPPVIFIACLSLWLLFAFPQVSHSQSAIGQLEDITGQKIQRYNVKSPNTPGMPKSPAGSMGLMLFQSLLGEALNAGADSQASAQQAAQRAELQAWMAQEQQRLTAMVAQQRVRRDQDDKASMEEMAKAMGSGFDTPLPKSDLASALSDPNVVDLRGYPADKPLFVGNLKQAIGNPFQSPAARKLRELIKENQDVRKLYDRQRLLENQLDAALQRARDLQNRSAATMKDFDDYEKSQTSVSWKALMEGVSLVLTPKGVGKTMLDKLTDLRNNPIEYDKTLKALEVISQSVSMTSGSIKYAVSEKQLMDAVDLIGKNLPVVKDYYASGKSIVQSAQTISKEIDMMSRLRTLENPQAYEGELKLGQAYWRDQRIINRELLKLIKNIQANRQQLAKQMGVSPDSLKELPRIGLDSKVTPLPAPLN